MPTYESLDNYGFYGRRITINGDNIVDAVEKDWSANILPHVRGNAAGCKVTSVELLPYKSNTTRGNMHFVTLRIVAKGQPLAHRPAGDTEYVTVVDFKGEFDGFAGHRFDLNQ